MNKEEQMEKALSACCDIANNYEEDEVIKFFPKSVQIAWKIGNEYLDHLLKESRKNRKDFTL